MFCCLTVLLEYIDLFCKNLFDVQNLFQRLLATVNNTMYLYKYTIKSKQTGIIKNIENLKPSRDWSLLQK